jgi:pimeloyl-ACP methyl ester carboxylesterase
MAEGADRLVTRSVSVRVRRAGAGSPVLFLHGARGWPAWLPFFERLSPHYALTVPEHPCFGGSDDPPWLRDVADLAMYYLDVLDQNFSAPVHVIGHSLGGWAATEAAVRNSSRIGSLTLLAPAGVRIKGVPPGDNFIWSPEEGVRATFYDQGLAEAQLKETPASEDELDIDLQNKLAAVKFGWAPRWLNPNLAKWLHRITVPTQIIWGRDDGLLPSAYAKLWSEHVPGAKISIIEACGHSPHIEHPDQVADEVLGFLAGRRA